MKLSKYLLHILPVLLMAGCYKVELAEPSLATLNSYYAIAYDGPENTNVLFDMNDSRPVFRSAYRQSWWEWDGFSNNGLRAFGMPADQPFKFSIYQEMDTLKSFYTQTIQPKAYEQYSLLMSGKEKGKVDVKVFKDSIPPFYTDSVMGLRFIHLSPDAGPVSVNLAGDTPGSQIASLQYQQVTAFKKYPALKANTGYTFEVRQISTGELLATYSFNTTNNYIARFKNVTMVLRGVISGGKAIELVKVSNF